jgi:hypothetical protein
MKAAITYFLLTFFMFSVIGGYAGWDRRKEVARDRVYRSIVGDRDEAGYFLLHECDGKWTHRFYVEQNRIRREVGTSARVANEFMHGPPSERHLNHREIVLGLLGGVSGGFSYKDILRVREQGVSRVAYWSRIIAGIAGMLSGYTFGNWAASNYRTGCESALAAEVLGNETEWRKIESQIIIFSVLEKEVGDKALFWKETGSKNFNPAADDPVVLCKTSLRQDLSSLRKQAEDPKAEFGDNAFALLYNTARRYKVASMTKEYGEIRRMHYGRIALEYGAALGERYSPKEWDETCAKLQQSIQNVKVP